ncbi:MULTISPECIES: hypothetical protein [Bacteroides]|uniref:hypothetical protein n=1 Tax=Bacteroides TaxID=816 RepID=UPI00207066DA|nr:hypothetical protein [Bacteroides nordii]MBD9110280.1 hypothetical protein [Bacteroides nordii]DAR04473.1 MAG TPA: hypothetical protein [Caudoviricetes sp.]
MALYTIYTYQFKPVFNLFNNEDCLRHQGELMSHKNKIFENAIKSCIFTHRNHKLSSQLLFCLDDIIAFKLANVKSVHLEQKFQIKTETDEPSVNILINNNPNVQRIAIEQNKAFTETGVVIKILKKAFNALLIDQGLSITIKKEYQEREFWDLINRNPDCIKMVRFEFDYPNLPRVSESVSSMLKQASEASLSAKTRLEFNSAEKECLKIEESNEQIKGLTQAASGSGNSVVFRVKGMKKLQRTGYTTKTISFDELEIQADNIEGIKEIFKSLNE